MNWRRPSIFPGICDVVRETVPSVLTPPFAWGSASVCPRSSGLNLQNDYDLRIAEGSGIGKGIRPRKVAYDAKGDDAGLSITMRSLLAPSALTPSLPSPGPSTPRPSAADSYAETLDVS